MIIGLGPEYNYPNKVELWRAENTRYASNHGASLISRALLKQFNGEHVETTEFNKIDELNEKFDQCIIAFATHVTSWRDVSVYTNFIEKLKIPVYAFSLGVQDYSGSATSITKIHPSLKRLLEIVSERSKLLGTRGHYTASILYKNGFKNVVPIGCPTMYWNLNRDLKIDKSKSFNNPAVVYHRTIAGNEGFHLLKAVPLVGQDFLDEVVFTSNLQNDGSLLQNEIKAYKKQGNYNEIMDCIKNNGVFHYTFQEWFDYLKTRDFVIGPRLHGCIGSLIQGIPAVMFARDLRVQEIAQFFNIPYLKYEELQLKSSIQQIYDEADFDSFNKTYKLRYDNYVNFLNENKLEHNLENSTNNESYVYSVEDLRTINFILNNDVQELKIKLDKFEKGLRTANILYDFFEKLPFAKKIGKSTENF